MLGKDSVSHIQGGNCVMTVQGEWMYELAKQCEYPIVEFGALRGRSTTYLALGSKAGNKVKVHSVDLFGFPAHKNLLPEEIEELKNRGEIDRHDWNMEIMIRHLETAGVKDLVNVHRKNIYDFRIDGKIGLFFVDADKNYNGMCKLWDMYWDKLVSGGYWITHDFKFDTAKKAGAKRGQKFAGIKKFFDEVIYPKVGFKIHDIRIINSLLAIRKP